MDTQSETHPLLQKELNAIRDWQAWKSAWDEAKYLEQLNGLLHLAFDVQTGTKGEWEERLLFLLSVADGYNDFSSDWNAAVTERYRLAGWHHDYAHRIVEGLKPTAEKAYKVLCDRYFKTRCGGQNREDVSPLGDMTPTLFGKLLWFFNDHDRRRFGRNLPRDGAGHHDGIARRYLLELIRQAWNPDCAYQHDRIRVDEELQAVFDAAKPRCVFLLNDLDELERLYIELVKYVDQPALEALRKLTLYKDGAQVFRTAEEAVDTYEGRTLLVLEAKLRNDERLRRIAEAERKQREAGRELEQARE